MLTIIENRLDMLEFLLKNWMKDCSTSDNTSHIMLAIQENNIEVLQLLLKYKADPFTGNNVTTPTLFAIESDKNVALECLLKFGNNLSETCNPIANSIHQNITPLMLAVKKNKLVSFELLLQYGANPFTYTIGLNVLHYAILNNRLEIVSMLKDCILKDCMSNDKYLINECTNEPEKRHSIFLALKTKDPIIMTDLILQSEFIEVSNEYHNECNILYSILLSKLKISIKTNLFKRYINRNIDLTNIVNSIPLVVYAVDNNMYDIVVMIMNKLIETKEISIKNCEDNDIIKFIRTMGNKKITVDVKNKMRNNIYPLVIFYLKAGKNEFIEPGYNSESDCDNKNCSEYYISDNESENSNNEEHNSEIILDQIDIESLQNNFLMISLIVIIYRLCGIDVIMDDLSCSPSNNYNFEEFSQTHQTLTNNEIDDKYNYKYHTFIDEDFSEDWCTSIFDQHDKN